VSRLVGPGLLVMSALLLTACFGGSSRSFGPGRDVLYIDNFTTGETGPWHTEGDEMGRTAVVGGRLLISIDAPQLMQFATLREPTFRDFSLDVEATLLDGPADASYGLLFRMQSPAEFYRFVVTGTGLYMIERRNGDGSWSRLSQEWAESPAIQLGLNATNRLQIIASGANFAFYVNDVLLRQVQDTAYAEGNLALDAGTFGQGGVQVAFDNLVVRRP
jgi:hypothetical protein